MANATYNITDNRLKVWFGNRLPDDEYKRARGYNFVWWPGRKCFSAIWTPGAEDFIKSYGIEIEEDDTPDDVESRVERFQKYAANDEESAEYAQERTRTANTRRQYEQAEATAAKKIDEARYWHDRIAGAIWHAAYKDKPDVIVRRIKKLEAEQRKNTKTRDEAQRWEKRWSDLHPLKLKDGTTATLKESASYFANYDSGPYGIWSNLQDDTITPEEAQEKSLAYFRATIKRAQRWLDHLNMRIEYETAYLEAVGGSADMLKPAPRRKSIAPDDGLKNGDIVMVPYSGRGYQRVEILTLSARTARVKFLDEGMESTNERYPKGYQAGRIFLKAIEQVSA